MFPFPTSGTNDLNFREEVSCSFCGDWQEIFRKFDMFFAEQNYIAAEVDGTKLSKASAILSLSEGTLVSDM